MEGYQFDVSLLFDILLKLYCSSLKLISSFLKFAILITKVCVTECIYGLKLPNEYKYSLKGKVYNGLGGLFHLTIRPGSMSIYIWSYSFELYHSMRGSLIFEQRMFFEWARFESFRKAPETLRMWRIKLAKDGFYYTGSGNDCKCAFCGLVYGNWRYTEDPENVHRRLSPNCPLVHDRMNTNNIPINATEGSQGQSAALSLAENPNRTAVCHHGHVSRYQDTPGPNVRDDVIIAIRRIQEQLIPTQHVREMQHAEYHNYDQLHTRIGTFREWPSNNQTPRDMAEAGFYYTGVGDCCRCFSCGGGIRQWKSGDDPWAEHARWFPNCDFVRKYKGDENVNNNQQQAELNNPGNSSENDVSSSKTTNRVETSPLMTGVNDSFDGGLRNWEPGDNPCPELARLLPNGDVVRKCKGGEFVNSIQQQEELANWQNKTHNDPGNSSENDVNNSKNTNIVEPSPLIAEVRAENHRLSGGLKCLKCTTERICMMFIPCGHTITCEDCSKTIQRCFKCNKVVNKALKVFIP